MILIIKKNNCIERVCNHCPKTLWTSGQICPKTKGIELIFTIKWVVWGSVFCFVCVKNIFISKCYDFFKRGFNELSAFVEGNHRKKQGIDLFLR